MNQQAGVYRLPWKTGFRRWLSGRGIGFWWTMFKIAKTGSWYAAVLALAAQLGIDGATLGGALLADAAPLAVTVAVIIILMRQISKYRDPYHVNDKHYPRAVQAYPPPPVHYLPGQGYPLPQGTHPQLPAQGYQPPGQYPGQGYQRPPGY